MKRRPGDVHPTEYAWQEQFDIDGMGYIKFDAGKVRGLAQYAEELEAERDRLRALVSEAIGIVDEYSPGHTCWLEKALAGREE